MTTNNTINCAAPETLTDRLIHIETERAVLDAEHRGLMAREDWLTQTTPGIEGAEYKGRGLWLYRGREVHAVPRAQGVRLPGRDRQGVPRFRGVRSRLPLARWRELGAGNHPRGVTA